MQSFTQRQNTICIMSAVRVCWSRSIAHLQISQSWIIYSTNMVNAEVSTPRNQRKYKWLLIIIGILILLVTRFCVCYAFEVTVAEAEQHSLCARTSSHTLEYRKWTPQTKSRACLYLIKVNETLLSSACRPAVIWCGSPCCGLRASELSQLAPQHSSPSSHSSPSLWLMSLLHLNADRSHNTNSQVFNIHVLPYHLYRRHTSAKYCTSSPWQLSFVNAVLITIVTAALPASQWGREGEQKQV